MPNEGNVYYCITSRIRVTSLSCQGTLSVPSLELQFQTLPRSEMREILTPKNASSHFTIECTGDICVGDTILFSERLFLKDGGVGVEAAEKGASGVNSVAGTNSKVTTGSRAATNKQGGTTTVRMDMSVTSAAAAAMAGLTVGPGGYIGERTVAAHVLKDNYRVIRDVHPFEGKYSGGVGRERVLWLEVM